MYQVKSSKFKSYKVNSNAINLYLYLLSTFYFQLSTRHNMQCYVSVWAVSFSLAATREMLSLA